MLGLVLATNVPYTRYHGGANRSNRALAEALAARGHAVSVVTPALSSPPEETYREWRDRRIADGDDLVATGHGERFRKSGVDLHAIADQAHMVAALTETIAREKPDWVLVSSEDPSQRLLATALEAAPDRVVYLALTPQLFPFGPESLYPGEERTRLVRRCRLRLALSRAAADYVERWAGVPTQIYAPPHFGPGPFPDLADPAGPALLINASGIKGLSVFCGLAAAFPERSFAALPGYATSSADRRLLGSLPNVEIRANAPSLDDVLAGSSVVLMPSLWFESFGLAAVDAMLRGIPVLASDHGALPEALLGTRPALPVRPIEGYRDALSETLLLEPILPDQEIGPWRDALADLWADPARYEAESRRVARVARTFVEGLSVEPVERLLAAEAATPAPRAAASLVASPAEPADREPRPTLSPAQKAEALRRMRARRGDAGRGGPSPIPRVPREGDLPLSPGQRRLYFLQRLEPGSPVYNTAFALRLKGRLDQPALARALDGLLERHEALRTAVIEAADGPVLRIAAAAGFPLETLRVRSEEDAMERLRARAARPFDLSQGPVARAHLAEIAGDDRLLLVVIHHIATDAWSTGILVRDLAALYAAAIEGRDLAADPDAVAFADYAAWRSGAEREGAARADEDYFVAALQGAPEAINLPSDRPRPAARKHLGDSLAIGFDATLTDRLGRVARDRGATLFMAMLAAWAVVLHRLGGDDDMVIGIPVANRSRAELERTVGFFVDTMPLRVGIAGNATFADLLSHVRDRVIEGFQHAGAGFERIVERLDPPRSRSHGPLVQTLFGLHNAPAGTIKLPGLSATPVPIHNGTAKFDLNVELAEVDGGIEGSVEFDTELFDRATVARMVEAWRTILEELAADPVRRIGSVPLLPASRIAEIHRRLNPPPAPLDPVDSIGARLGAAASRAPEAEALRLGDAVMSYAELDRRTERLAGGLAARGVGPDVAVAFATERGFDRIVAMLGILRAGGACVPLELGLPTERLRHVLANSRAPFVLAHAATRARAETLGAPVLDIEEIASGEAAPLPGTVPHEATAYILYTSGSTGVPKGVAYPHGAELNLMAWFVDRLPSPARSLQFASIGFDASFNESLSVLMTGGALNLLTEAERADVTRAVDVYLEQGIERAVVSVVLLNLLAERILERAPAALALREIIATGEQLKITPAVEALLARCPGIRLWNDYGPTESNVVTALEVTARADHYGALPPIGRPVRASRCYVLDRYLHAVPEGLPGQLFLAGTALARGYNGDPALTAASFPPDPFAAAPGERMYRSGDIARLRADGALELIGRADDQLKIRGFRVEPAEVEIALRAHPSVGDCLVIARVFPGDDRRLVAYVVAGSGPPPVAATLRAHLADRLPDYMVPAHIVLLPRFELNTNGKIDRSRLPLPQAELAGDEELLAPRTEIEEVLLALWQDVLDIRKIDIRDDFFSLGGHSLLIIRIIARLRERLGVELPLATFLDGPTIEQLAVAITALMADTGDEDDLEALLAEIEGAAPSVDAAPETLDADALRRVLVARAGNARPGPGVAAIGVPSSDRPRAVAECLASYLENARDHGHRPDVVVCGAQRDPATDGSYRQALAGVACRFDLAVSYAGEAETAAFVGRLAEAAKVDPAVVRFALSDSEGVGSPYGVNRNALLLHNAGRTFVSVDDDTRAQMRFRAGADDAVALRSEAGVSEIRIVGTREEALAAASRLPCDWLGRHADHLGADAASLFASDPDRPLDTRGARAEAFARLAAGDGRIVTTYHGWIGDSGWTGAEEARWLTGPSFEHATADADTYARALAGREVLRDVPAPTLGRGGDFFCLSAGFDARQPLVPFLPVQRREDALFGWLSMLVDPAALSAHLPGMVLHDRPTRGGEQPVSDPIDLAALVRAALGRESGLPEGASERLEALGARLRRATEAGADAFDGWLRDRALADATAELDAVEARIAACPPQKAFWARDAEIAVGLARSRLAATDSHLPRALGPDLDRAGRIERVRRLLGLYGALMEAWPALMATAADLREAGVTLARPVLPTRVSP
ncbi:amino acid adenylation domain-containing protein [Salinarimonas sp.]|uniref:amino acid adenylation domain-containing protein n=1 Tax=Salinarimonas sp. TaxID=2766526 RepID=UPI0032D8D17B